jgi:hypothetical protein
VSAKDRQCCDEIIGVQVKQDEIAKDVHDLKGLYEPVQKLKTIFYILSVFVVIMIGLSGFLWRDINALKTKMYDDNQLIMVTINDYNNQIRDQLHKIELKLELQSLKNAERELNYLKKLMEKENGKDKRPNR